MTKNVWSLKGKKNCLTNFNTTSPSRSGTFPIRDNDFSSKHATWAVHSGLSSFSNFPMMTWCFVGVDRLSGAHRCFFKLRVMRGQTARTLIWSCWRHAGLWRTAKTPLQNWLKVISSEGFSCLMRADIITWKRTPSARFGFSDEGTKHVLFLRHPLNRGSPRENMWPQTWSGASCSNEQFDDHLENTLKKVPLLKWPKFFKIPLFFSSRKLQAL